MSAKALKLGLFSQSSFPAAVSPELLACSPTLDLAATVNNANTLAIRRAQGELVSSSTDRAHTVQALCWRPDGPLSPLPSLPFFPWWPTSFEDILLISIQVSSWPSHGMTELYAFWGWRTRRSSTASSCLSNLQT